MSDFDLDEKKDKDLIYLKKRNAALLKIEGSDINNVLIDDTIVYNGLDVFSKVTSNYLEEEKDYRYITETKSQRDKRRKEREDKLRAQGAFVEDTSEIENDNKSSKKGLFKKKNKKEVCDKENEELTLNEEKEIVSDESEISDNESLKSENIENIDKEDDLSKEDDK